jgi:hypothetical protein
MTYPLAADFAATRRRHLLRDEKDRTAEKVP